MNPRGDPAPVSFSALVPVVIGLCLSADEVGLDLRPRLLPCLALTAAAEGRLDPFLAHELERVLHPSRQEQIAALYDTLAELASTPDEPDARAEYDVRLAELRALQREDAADLERLLVQQRALDPQKLNDAMARAQEILSRHADATGADDPT